MHDKHFVHYQIDNGNVMTFNISVNDSDITFWSTKIIINRYYVIHNID